MKKIVSIIAGVVGLYLFSTGISFAVFSYFLEPPTFDSLISPIGEEKQTQELSDKKDIKPLLDISGKKSEECPINGLEYTKNEKESWEKRRPLLVMIENHLEARPQSGLSFADVVYEAVAEGGITRFMGVFYCQAQAYEVILGPIRSARTYFLDWASEYGGTPLYTHVGGANAPGPANALGQIEGYGWGGAKGNDLNQFSIGFPTFWRDYERLGRTVATEHTMYSTTERLWSVAKQRGWLDKSPDGDKWDEDFVQWQFAKKASLSGDKSALEINYPFWEGYSDYSVKWVFDQESKTYKRFNGGTEHKDLDTDQQLETGNLVVLQQSESRANDGYPGNVHLLYRTIGQGKAWFFQNGQAATGTWVKKSRLARTKFLDSKGKEIKFVKGKIWISVVPVGVTVDYK